MSMCSRCAMARCCCVGVTLTIVGVLLLFAPAVSQNVSKLDFTFGPGTCPGLIPEGNLSSGSYNLRCSESCQEATCTALQKFFQSTYNATTTHLKSWRNRRGWEALLAQNCTQILATPTAAGTPAYCSWHGITCCHKLFQPFCNVKHTLFALNVEVNGLNGSVVDPVFMESIAQLHACGLLILELAGNALSGSMDDSWGELRSLRILNLAKNMVEGTIPESLKRLDRLSVLNLDGNPMHGTIPAWLSEMRSLKGLGLSALAGRNEDGRQGLIGTIPPSLGKLQNLELLSLDTNSLTGPFPPQACHSNISILILRSNRLTWSMADLRNCTKLSFVDFSRNRHRGPLPDWWDAWEFDELLWLNLHSNGIKGTIPRPLFTLMRVSTLNLANNRLTGTIDSTISQMPFLTSLDLRGNNLSGTIDESLWYTPRLNSLDLSSNNLTGSISPAIALGNYLMDVRLDDNQLTGRIPQEIALLQFLETMHLRGNFLSCNATATNTTSTGSCNSRDQALPCFLHLTKYRVPRPDGSNIECPEVKRKLPPIIIKDCTESGLNTLNDTMRSRPLLQTRVQDWYLDPSYYQYQGCRCLNGYSEVWTNNQTMLTCEGAIKEPPPFVVPLSAALTTTFVLLLAATSLIVWMKLTVQLRRKWQREKELKSNRLKGVPRGGPVAIVVTDVQGYSELMQQNAATTVRAMGMHNAILRKAVATHAGHVIEQEGDSWSLAFHRSVDAVAFCLQVQQALQRSNWPCELLDMTSTSTAEPKVPTAASTAGSHSSHMTPTSDRKHQAGSLLKPTESINSTAVITGSSLETELAAASKGSMSGSMSPLNTPVDRLLSCRIKSAMQSLISRSSSEPPAKQYATPCGDPSVSGTAVVELSDCSDDFEGSMQPTQMRHVSSAHAASANTRGGSWTSASKNSANFLRNRRKASNEDVVGLKVRMGIASGWVRADGDINTSAVFALAKAVSDMANGGQILMESRTAEGVHDWLSDLGCVDHKGYNDKLLSSPVTFDNETNTSRVTRWFLRLMGCCFNMTSEERDPVLLDLGQYWVACLASTIQAVKAAKAGTQATSNMQQPPSGRHQTDVIQAVNDRLQEALKYGITGLWQQRNIKACVAVAASALMSGLDVNGMTAADSINLFSIVAHPLQARSKLWRNEMNLKEGTQQLSRGYFDAPGTTLASVSSMRRLEAEHSMGPSVTVVFAAVEGGKQLVRKNEHVAKLIHNVICRIMQAVLLSFPDGYLCREQEAVLKYMVAFKEPTRAAEWCLLVQEVLHHIPWPAQVTAAMTSKGSPPWSPRTARRLTATAADAVRRPGLKMGLADGIPDSIAPDHLGRADYFGTSVNLAARIMDAAADSGHVTMSCELADIVFSVWRYEAQLRAERQEAGITHGSAVSDAPASNLEHLADHQTRAQQAAEEQLCSRSVRISAYHTGTYVFKGCGEIDAVCLRSDALCDSAVPTPGTPPKSVKGTLVAATTGPVAGMQKCTVTVPCVLQEFQDVWSLVGDQVADAHYMTVHMHRSPVQQSPRSPFRHRRQAASR